MADYQSSSGPAVATAPPRPAPRTGRAALSPQINALLASLRTRIHVYVWVQGIALAIAWLAAAFWITIALDWWIEPPPVVRQIMIGGVAVVLVYLIYRYILRRAFVRLADTNLAMLLERRFKGLGDSLLTTVELADHPDHATEFNSQMLSNTQGEALRHLPEVRVADVFRSGPLIGAIVGAVLGVASVAAFAIFLFDPFTIWVDRNLMFSENLWPRRTHISIEGFLGKRIKIAKGSDVKIIARADTHFVVPETVQIRYRAEDGKLREKSMSRMGTTGEDEKYQEYSFVFQGIPSSRTFDLVGGDMTLRGFQIDVVDVPAIEMTLHCVFPAYMRRVPSDPPVTGAVQLPQGTAITVVAKANKDLVEVPIGVQMADQTKAAPTIKLANSDRRHFSYKIASLDEDQTLLFTLTDTDGITTKDPVRLTINAQPDEPPHVGVHLRGISTKITPDARLPIEGEITDDYGISKIWYEFKFDQDEAVKIPLRLLPRDRTALKFDRVADEALDLTDHPLTLGKTLSLTIMAQDNSTLKHGPNVAPSERYQLEVVSPEQLMSMLEARELTLRLRLEQIAQDLTATRDQLAHAEFASPKAPSPGDKAAADKAASDKAAAAKKSAGEKSAPGAEPEDSSAAKSPPKSGTEAGDDASSGPGLHSPAVVIEQTLANSERGASEIASLAVAFDDIREEMVNNRVETPELEYRLKDQIADPLRHIAETSFPELDRRLKKLQGVLADSKLSRSRHAEALQQVDAILVEMRLVMNKMLELESFNEIIEHLREIIKLQRELDIKTQHRQKENKLKLDE